jgi:ABC-type transport system substrate-binding protein
MQMKTQSLKAVALVIVVSLVAAILISCGGEEATSTPEPVAPEATTAPGATEAPAPTELPPTEAPPTEAPEPAEETSVVIAIPEDPPSFNGIVTDTGYEQMAAKLVLLGMAGVDPNGEVYPVLAAELPTEENGDVVVDEDEWTMDVTWKMRDHG